MPFDLTKYAETAKKDTTVGFDLSKYGESKEGKSLWSKYWEAEKFLGKEAAGFVKRSVSQVPELLAGFLPSYNIPGDILEHGRRAAELETQRIVGEETRKATGVPEPSFRKGYTMQALGQIPFAGVIPRAISDPKETLYERTLPTIIEAGALVGLGRGLFRGRGRPTEVPKVEAPPVELPVPQRGAAPPPGREILDLTKALREKGVTEAPPIAPTAKAPKPPAPGAPDTKVRGLAKHIEDKAIETGLTKGFEGLPEYDVMSMKEQAGRAATLIAKDPAKAQQIAMGEAPPEGGVTAEMVMVGIERAALEAGDVGTIRNLALNSRLMTEATEMGQRIRTLGERDPTSPVGAIQEVVKAREKVVRRKITNVEAAKEKTVNDLKTQIKRARPSRQTWEQFIESIRC